MISRGRPGFDSLLGRFQKWHLLQISSLPVLAHQHRPFFFLNFYELDIHASSASNGRHEVLPRCTRGFDIGTRHIRVSPFVKRVMADGALF